RPPERWREGDGMQAVAGENKLSETAFTIPSERDDADFELRWFTPTHEVDLCGHATIAAGHALMTGHALRFSTKAGILIVSRRDDLLELDLPVPALREVREPALNRALGVPESSAWLPDGCN